MAINIQTLEPAVLKAKEVATLEDVEQGVTHIDGSNIVTGTIKMNQLSTFYPSNYTGTVADSKGIRVYDENGVCRVKLGRLD